MCPITFSKIYNTGNGKIKCRCFCFTPALSAPTLHVMETGPLLFTHLFTYKFPSFFLIQKALRKTQEDSVNAILITWIFATLIIPCWWTLNKLGGLRLATWLILSKELNQREYIWIGCKKLITQFITEEQVQKLVMNQTDTFSCFLNYDKFSSRFIWNRVKILYIKLL